MRTNWALTTRSAEAVVRAVCILSAKTCMAFVCSGCGLDTSSVSHTCDVCGNRNHPFCGTPVEEKQGGHVRCSGCSSPAKVKEQHQVNLTPERTQPTSALKSLRQNTMAKFLQPLGSNSFQGSEEEECDASADKMYGGGDGDNTDESVVVLNGANARAFHRAPQVVAYLTDRTKVVAYMQALHDSGETRLPSKAVANFPRLFTGNQKANLQKASRLWKERERHLEKQRRSVVAVQNGVKKRMRKKAAPGRGRRRAPWVEWLYSQLLGEFCRLRKTGIKISRALLQQIAVYILSHAEGDFRGTTLDDKGVQLQDRITYRWIQHFCCCFDIVGRKQSGRLECSPEKEEEIERSVAAHLGKLKRAFDSGQLDENEVFNMDEAHFVVNIDDKKTLGFREDKIVRYHDVVSGGEGMTLVVKIRGGPSARIEPPMVIFQNRNRSYPIANVKDNEPGVTYRSGPKGWMDHQVFHEWIKDNTCNRRHPRGKSQVVYLDNASGHAVDECSDALSAKNMSVRFLPSNATHLCQPADSFIIKAIKEMWTTEWDKEKYRLAEEAQFSTANSNGKWSGKLKNPGKPFFLKLAARCARAVSQKKDKNGVSYPRKAVILCGLSKDINGVWQESQLSKRLQDIIEKYREDFEGQTTAQV